MHKISIIGLGKLGLCMAACFASKGYKVIGVDIDEVKVDRVNKGECPINETGLSSLVKKYRKNIHATYDYGYAIKNSDVTFIVVATPSNEDGNFSNAQLEAACIEMAEVLKNKKTFHVISITSTVTPGVLDSLIKPLFERITKKKCGKDFGLAYNPEFIALGSVIHDFQNPDFILIGESDKKTGEILSKIYRKTCDNNPVFARMNFINAEISKLSLNCYVTMKISFANTLSEICEKHPGANVDAITNAIGIDTRIGWKYLKGGLGFGGPCFPRDNRALVAFTKTIKAQAELPKTVDKVNRLQIERILALTRKKIRKGSKVSILGLSYKPNTEIVEDSQAVDIASAIKELGAQVYVYDPMANSLTKRIYGDRFKYANNINDCLKNSEACIVTTAWQEFKNLKPARFEKLMKSHAILVDCWRLYDKDKFKKINCIGLGLGLER
ncbi:MAG: UDP-glucose/GDP-mannose dehydrogenase family protein [Candidatus Omnitrophica bacterium]|nr:UDP-glucose/GDP-mannose dehydrogenase family protein [Candidatus Omnitrophota bacterium]